MKTKNLDNYFNPKLEELEKLKIQKELIEAFPGEIFIETLIDETPFSVDSSDLKREEFVSRDYSLANKFQIINGFGYYNGHRISSSNNNRFCIFDLYFELKHDKSDLILPVHCRHEDIGMDERNIIYKTHTSFSGHYDEFETTRRFHPVPLNELVDFYDNQGLNQALLFNLYTKINDIRKECPAGIVLGGRR